MSVKCPYLSTTSLLVFAAIFAAFLASPVSLNKINGVADEANITVPVSCSLEGTGMNTHNASTIQ